MLPSKPLPLIDFGNLEPDQQAYNFVEIEVGDAAQMEGTESIGGWLHTWSGSDSTRILASGRQLVHFCARGLSRLEGSLAIGNLRLVSSTGETNLWATVRTVDLPQTGIAGVDLLLRPDSGVPLRASAGLILGRGQLPSPAFQSTSLKEAFVGLDPVSGHWVLYRPWRTETEVAINGEPVSYGSRRILAPGDLLLLGPVLFRAEPAAEGPLLEVPSGWQELEVQRGQPARHQVALRNQGIRALRVEAKTQLPWLRVEPVRLDLNPGERGFLTLVIDSAVPAGTATLRERSGLALVTDEAVYFVDLAIREREADQSLPRTPASSPSSPLSWTAVPFLSLGAIHQDGWGQGLAGEKFILVANRSSFALELTIRSESDCPFSHPHRLSVPAHAKGQLGITLRPKPPKSLRLGPLETDIVLSSDRGDQRVRLSVMVLAPKGGEVRRISTPFDPLRASPAGVPTPDLQISPPSLEFSRGTSPALARSLSVTNRSERPVAVTLESKTGWLRVDPPGRVLCGAGASQVFEVRFVPSPFLKNETFQEPRGLVLITRETNIAVPVVVTAASPHLQGANP